MLMVAAAVVLALGGVLAFVVIHGSAGSTPVAAPPRQQHFPKKWDRRITPYAKIASRERRLDYQHPVAVRFLSTAAFNKSLRAEDAPQTKKDRQAARQSLAILRALGLVSGQPDLNAASRSFGDTAILAYYSFRTRSITVRGTKITAAMKSTLVHELTHVLQDQNFNVGDELKRLQARQKATHQGDAASVLDAVVEGDAERVEGLYRNSLPARQRRALDASQAAEARAARRQIAKLPKVVTTFLTSPYTLGIGLVRTADEDGGNDAVDKLLQFPPDHTSALIDPLRAITDSTGGATVAAPTLGAGEKKFDAGEFGALTWYLMLSSHLPAKQALAAADGWAGDAYVGFHRGGTTCARIAFAGRNAADDSLMLGALHTWVGRARGTHAQVTSAHGRITFESCDPGRHVRAGNDSSDQAIALVSVRTQIVDALLHSQSGIATARCLSDKLVQTFTLTQLEDPTFGSNDPAITARIGGFARACASP
jgi:hypothetical protein